MQNEYEIDPTLGLKLAEYEEQCPYLPDRQSSLPLYMPLERVSGPQFDTALDQGARRTGPYLYVTRCNNCQACEAIRIEVNKFSFRRRHKRVLKKCEQVVSVTVGSPKVDSQRVELYNQHKLQRNLGEEIASADSYEEFLVNSCCNSLEFCYFVDQELVAVAIADAGEQALSAVYCYYNPSFDYLNLGTYSVLKQIEYCVEQQMQFLYLGFYVEDCSHMNYKASFLPHQRRIAGSWVDFQA